VKGSQTALFQVKSITHNFAGWSLTVSPEDIAGIRPSRSEEVGYFAILDCAVPVSWLVNEYDAIRRHEAHSVSIETLRVSANSELSSESTATFADLVMRHKNNLHLLTFRVLCQRALRGEQL
jgi:hypothetical protein